MTYRAVPPALAGGAGASHDSELAPRVLGTDRMPIYILLSLATQALPARE